AAEALFGKGELASLDTQTLHGALAELPRAQGGVGTPITELFVSAGLVKGSGEARRAIAQGGIYINNTQVTQEDAALAPEHLIHDTFVVLRRGKRTLAAV